MWHIWYQTAKFNSIPAVEPGVLVVCWSTPRWICMWEWCYPVTRCTTVVPTPQAWCRIGLLISLSDNPLRTVKWPDHPWADRAGHRGPAKARARQYTNLSFFCLYFITIIWRKKLIWINVFYCFCILCENFQPPQQQRWPSNWPRPPTNRTPAREPFFHRWPTV